MPTSILLRIAAGNHDADAALVAGVQTGFSVGASNLSFLFQGAAPLKGTVINSAVLRTRHSFNGAVFNWHTEIALEDADDALPFTNGEPYSSFTDRPRTAVVDWLDTGLVSFVAGQQRESIDIAPAVQAVVNRPGFGDTLHVFWQEPTSFPFSFPFASWQFDHHPTVAAELLIEYTPAASPSAQVTAAEAIVAALTAGSFSQEFTPIRSYAQWQRPFEVAEAVGLQVDVVQFSPMDDDLASRGSIQYAPAIDIVIRKKFAAADLEEVPGENEARVKTSLVDGLVALLEAINESLTARRIGGDNVVWKSNRVLATYLPTHLRDKHQFTGVIRVTTEVVKELPEP